MKKILDSSSALGFLKVRTAGCSVGRCGYLLLGFIGIFTFVMSVVSPISWQEGLAFWLYQAFGILLPGMALVCQLKLPGINELEAAVWGYGMGFALNIVQYFILAPLHLLKYAAVCQVVIALIAISSLLLLPGKKPGKLEIKYIFRILGILVTLNLLIRFFTYYAPNLLPDQGRDVVFGTQDILFYIGNAVSAGKGFPLEEFRFAGETFRYHYFGSLQLEMASLVTGITELKLELCLMWVQMSILLIGSFWCLLRRLGIQVKYCILGEILLLFTAGLERIVYIAFQEKMYVVPFGYDSGLAFAILTVTFVRMQNQKDKFQVGIFISALSAFAVCMGAKAPVALVLLFFLGCLCAKWLFAEHRFLQAFGYGILFLGLFLLIFFGIVSDGMSTVTVNETGLRFSLTGHLYESGLGAMYFRWVENGMPQILGKGLLLIYYFLGANPAVFGLFAVAGILVLGKRKKKLISFEGILFVTVITGMLMTLLTKQQGNSQMYFAMAVVPFAIVCVMLWLNLREPLPRLREPLFWCGIGTVVTISMLCFGMVLKRDIQRGYEKLGGRDVFEGSSNSLTWEEAQAYEWIRENTPEEALFLCNTILHEDQYESFIVGVSTRRQMWMEGWRYVAGYLDYDKIEDRRKEIARIYDGDGKAAETAVQSGMRYLIWIKRYDPLLEENTLPGEKIFENEGAAVFELDSGNADLL